MDGGNLSLVVPAVALFTAAVTIGVTVYLWVLNRNREHSKELAARLDQVFTQEMRDGLRTIAAAWPEDLVFDPELRNDGLNRLIALQKVAGSVSANPKLWEYALGHEDYALLLAAVRRSGALLQLVRNTHTPLGRTVWNGRRSRAFSLLLTACGLRLPGPNRRI